MKKIKNISGSTKIWCGQVIENNAYYTLQLEEHYRLGNDATVLTALSKGEAAMNDGSKNITDRDEAITFLKEHQIRGIKRLYYHLYCETEETTKEVWIDRGDAHPTQCPTNPAHTIDESKTQLLDLEAVYENMDSNLEEFLNETTIVTDPVSNISGPYHLMELLNHRKDLYNDDENPLYEEEFTPILGAGGYLVDHATRINSLETIHAKLGWHNQEVQQGKYTRPKDLLIYYGWLNSFNSAQHAWYNEKVAQEMARYSLLVFGNGLQDPTHGDYVNTQIIIPRIKALNPSALIFGYVTVNQTLANFKSKVDQWDTLQVHGIFMDEAGYDYGKTRAEFNERVDYVHGKTYAKLAFANACNTDHVLGITDDTTYPNATYNDPLTASKLNISDWILLESFPINTTAYTASTPDGYEPKGDWASRGVKAINLRATYGVNFAGSGIINNGNAGETDLFNFGFISALMFSLDGFGTSDTSYGASSAKTKFIARPDVSKMGVVWSLNPAVQLDTLDADVYHRYVENAKLTLDFSDSAQLSSITKY
jgi:hypothetical protein